MARPQGQRGNAIVEFALVAPLLLFLLIATVVMALAINAKIVISGAAREAARSYAVHQDHQAARERAREAVLGGGLKQEFQGRPLFNPNGDVRISRQGDYVYVTVSYRQPMFVPGLPKLLDRNAAPWTPDLHINSLAVFRVE